MFFRHTIEIRKQKRDDGFSKSETTSGKSALLDKYKSHLHEQFAINNNASLQSVIMLLVAMLGVLYAYGYVFLHTEGDFGWILFNCDRGTYTPLALLLVSYATLLVLAIMTSLCMYQGVAQRREQFIVYGLRREVGFNMGEGILPDGYSPYNKKGIQILPGLYGQIVSILAVVMTVVVLATLGCFRLSSANLFCCGWIAEVLFAALIFSYLAWKYNHETKKYYMEQETYKKTFKETDK